METTTERRRPRTVAHPPPAVAFAVAVAVAVAALLTGPTVARAAGDSDEGGAVLRHGSVVLKPDIKLYADYQIDLLDPLPANGFHITRGYLGFKLKAASWLGARITLDVSQQKDVGASGALTLDDDGVAVDDSKLQGSLVARVKYAYLDLGIAPAAMKVRFGIGHTPYIDWVEHIEGTRFLRKVMIETAYHYPSADFGVSLLGHVGDHLAYHVGIYNGEGYHGLEELGLKDVAARVSLRPAPGSRALGGLQISGYVRMELPWDDEAETHRQYGGAITYRLAREITSPDCTQVDGDKFALWIQAIGGHHGVAGDLHPQLGLSAGARVELPARLFVIARGDRFDPDLHADDDLTWRTLVAFGVRAHDTFHVALNWQGTLASPAGPSQLVGVHTEFHL